MHCCVCRLTNTLLYNFTAWKSELSCFSRTQENNHYQLSPYTCLKNETPSFQKEENANMFCIFSKYRELKKSPKDGWF